MSSERDTQHFFARSQAPPLSQLCEDTRPETSDGGTAEVLEVRVKKERLELDISDHEDDLDNTPEVISIKVEDPEHSDYLYCEICKSVFFNKCEVHGPPLFIPDTPVPMGVSDRARQTLPLGLEIQKSSIPNAGLGVFNKGETVPVGAHFGPYQGELVNAEEAMNSRYSWVIYQSRECEEYVDATSEMIANWMRYVNCARHDEEQNLVAFQYQGGILYRCCRPINPGQELLVWYEEEYAKELSPAFDYLWNKKCSTNEINTTLDQVFSCSACDLSYASQIYLDKHNWRCHHEESMRLQESGKRQIPFKGCSSQPMSSDTLSSDIHHCSDCGKTFSDQNALKSHQCVHTVEKPYQCSECGKRFTQRGNLQRHQRLHTGEKPYQCSQCGKCFTCQSHLQQHQRIHTGEKPYHCSQCGKRFAHPGTFQKHQRIHTGEKPYCCSQCGKRFTQQGTFQKHQHLHTGEKPYHCSHCGKSFTQQGTLQQHQRLHTGEKPYHCSECGKNFNRQSSLQQHQRIHTGEKPYHCSHCGKMFTQQGTLQKHQRLHTGQKPFHCSQCLRSFNERGAFQTHQCLHRGEKPHHCSQCGKTFVYLVTFNTHKCTNFNMI
ncbi:uncharacterized protein Hap1MRO34_006827 [Clarias gariepinus]|uniref:histone-lysine N-methyltransferase PRDM9-like isoform X1 n=1 Tax=Clarias gariepinus TaxID=13013 RepID=UPI00234C899B|nr:histone-lysine N-methyltransferase PRDM9-like isoform X1 [Clarias gariepinus]